MEKNLNFAYGCQTASLVSHEGNIKASVLVYKDQRKLTIPVMLPAVLRNPETYNGIPWMPLVGISNSIVRFEEYKLEGDVLKISELSSELTPAIMCARFNPDKPKHNQLASIKVFGLEVDPVTFVVDNHGNQVLSIGEVAIAGVLKESPTVTDFTYNLLTRLVDSPIHAKSGSGNNLGPVAIPRLTKENLGLTMALAIDIWNANAFRNKPNKFKSVYKDGDIAELLEARKVYEETFFQKEVTSVVTSVTTSLGSLF